MKRPFLPAGILGIIAIILAFNIKTHLKGHQMTPQPPFTQPILALEFAHTPETLQTLLGTGEVRRKNIATVRKAQNADNFFIAGYTLFLLAFAFGIWRLTRRHVYALLVLLALAVGLSDLFENGAIRLLIDHFEAIPSQVEVIDFQRLQVFAWAKWLGLAVFFVALGPYLRSARGLGYLLALAGILAAVLGALACFSPVWIEKYATMVFAVFPLAVLFCFWHREKE